MRLEALSEGQIRDIYTRWMLRDFPESELKPLIMLISSQRRGIYDIYGAYEEDALVGYAMVYHGAASRVMLLDYLGVDPDRQGQGLGARILDTLRTHYADRADALLIESEYPGNAPDHALAERRIRFYTRCGAILTGVRVDIFDVDYSILALCCGEAAEHNWASEMLSIYRSMLPPKLFEEQIHLIEG